ncbi:DUF6218 family protein [Pseudonocardia alaniniphila]|uniref:DUF6218 family protein n=1 Tax=Pseudonocardia alaniniphila TaxID=75291 RepID=A0ABS9T9G5_9PSEU|nr:DUF6218 family protein [Pseudonocardia alaniniphila]MCH6165175.1 DUF6218 family protein [Pseudonocardia alaniniphila]
MVATDELSAPTQLEGLWATGSAVLALGQDENGGDAIALWQISGGGKPTGAWVERQEQAFGDRETARRLLTCIERRALTAADLGTVDEALTKLTTAAGVDRGGRNWWDTHVFSLTEAFAELVGRRGSFEQTVAQTKESGRSVAALEWSRDFPTDNLPSTLTELRELARLGVPAGAPAVAEVLTIANVLRWVVELWGETEQVKGRRRYILEKHGPVEALPPSWQAALTSAGVNRLAL